MTTPACLPGHMETQFRFWASKVPTFSSPSGPVETSLRCTTSTPCAHHHHCCHRPAITSTGLRFVRLGGRQHEGAIDLQHNASIEYTPSPNSAELPCRAYSFFFLCFFFFFWASLCYRCSTLQEASPCF